MATLEPIYKFLNDPNVEEIAVNQPGEVGSACAIQKNQNNLESDQGARTQPPLPDPRRSHGPNIQNIPNFGEHGTPVVLHHSRGHRVAVGIGRNIQYETPDKTTDEVLLA